VTVDSRHSSGDEVSVPTAHRHHGVLLKDRGESTVIAFSVRDPKVPSSGVPQTTGEESTETRTRYHRR
jgi:hypothetical protein